jgi:spermidine synthase
MPPNGTPASIDHDDQESSTDAANVPAPTDAERRETLTLLASIFVIAACGLIYELLIATVSSYLLGSSVTQFSISIGAFIGAMGVGSHLSQSVQRNVLGTFIFIEIALGVIGGISVCLLFWAYSAGALYWVVLYGGLLVIGALTGLELPLLTRLLKPYGSLREVIARALSYDYIGALAGSLLFPLLLLPSLGMARTAFLVGLLNIAVALWNVRVFRHRLRTAPTLLALSGFASVVLLAGFAYAPPLVNWAERQLYEDEIVYSAQTPYQRIVVTRWREDFRLFLDGNLQFASTDEYRYHEALIHPAMSLSPKVESVLLLGGGDGLAVREVLKHRGVQRITLVDIDPRMTDLGKSYPALVELNKSALHDRRVRLVHQDAHKFLEQDSQLYDVIVADLPDPNTDVVAKLYSVEFYKLIKRRLAASGVFVTQATSPFFAREAFWCIAQTVEDSGMQTAPYHTYVPSFGDWGFVLAAPRNLRVQRATVQVPTSYLTTRSLQEMFVLSRDVSKVAVASSTMNHPTILNYYVHNWKEWE